jgi:hypothetical protein
MAAVINKRKFFSVEEKVKILGEKESGGGGKKDDVCREYGLVYSTVETCGKNSASAFEENG